MRIYKSISRRLSDNQNRKLEFSTMLAFAISVFLLVVTPGPAVLSLAGIGSAFGYRAGINYLGGLIIGYHLVILAVVSGLASIILAAPLIRNILLVASAGYLGFLAFRIAYAGSKIAFITPEAKARPDRWSGPTVGQSQSLCSKHITDEWVFISS
jgi:threonine/homoserine/homoserine lactone efflux protein